MSADTIVPGYTNPQSLNRYSYVTNNPLRYTDPTGHAMSDGGGGGHCDLNCVQVHNQNNNHGGGGGNGGHHDDDDDNVPSASSPTPTPTPMPAPTSTPIPTLTLTLAPLPTMTSTGAPPGLFTQGSSEQTCMSCAIEGIHDVSAILEGLFAFTVGTILGAEVLTVAAGAGIAVSAVAVVAAVPFAVLAGAGLVVAYIAFTELEEATLEASPSIP